MPPDPTIVIRSARADDGPALRRLAALDSARPLQRPVLLASVDGVVVAARSLADGRAIADPFVPGGPVPDVNTLAGTAERTATVDAQVRWWPASGVDFALTAGHDRVENAAHVPGVTATGWHGALAFRLSR